MALSGPAPWNAQGKAEFTFLLIPIKVSFDKTWGKKQTLSNRKYIDLLPILAQNFNDSNNDEESDNDGDSGRNGNWRIISGDIVDGLVRVIEFCGDDLVMQPSDRLSFSQSAIPFGQNMVHYGEALPGDAKKIELVNVNMGLDDDSEDLEIERTKSAFAPTLIRELNEKEKLKSPSYVDMEAGFNLNVGSIPKRGEAEKLKTGVIVPLYQQINWDRWEQDVANLNKKEDARPDSTTTAAPVTHPLAVKTVLAREKKVSSRRTDDQRLADKLDGKIPVSRASFRKTNNGFNRYTRELDKNMNNKLDHLFKQLDKKLEK
jgi:hypothetical protein